MNILVCISKTPDTTSKIAFSADKKTFISDGVTFILNPYDEWYALVRALELVESTGGNVTVINVGSSSNDIVIRKALAIGANEAVRIDIEPQDAYIVAANIAEYAKSKNFDLIMTGKETIDYNGSEIGAMIAELLDLPYISYANHLDKNGDEWHVSREIEGGNEICAISGAFVLSAAKGMAEQRIPNMKGIMMAKSKPLQVLTPYITESNLETLEYNMPPTKTGVKLIDPENLDELVKLLHEEAKVI